MHFLSAKSLEVEGRPPCRPCLGQRSRQGRNTDGTEPVPPAAAKSKSARLANRLRPSLLLGTAACRRHTANDLGHQFLVALVQGLNPNLPPMKLNAELVDIAVDLGALRFVFLKMAAQLRQSIFYRLGRRVGRSFCGAGCRRMGRRLGKALCAVKCRRMGHGGWSSATLAIQG
jgi:hypothetical protein